jgi:hypothetical protein
MMASKLINNDMDNLNKQCLIESFASIVHVFVTF